MQLRSISCESTQQKWQSLESFDPRDQSWVVSDLRSKLEVQSYLLGKTKGIPADAVIRARELWLQIFRRTFPSTKLVTLDWIYLQSSHWLMTSHQVMFAENPSLMKTVVDLVDTLSSIFWHPNREEILEEFFKTFPATFERFEKVWPMCLELADYLQEHHLVTENWVPAVLENSGWSGQVPGLRSEHSFVFDLGGSLSSFEAQLIEKLGRSYKVLVLAPSLSWIDKFPFLLQPYKAFPAQVGPSMEKLSSAESRILGLNLASSDSQSSAFQSADVQSPGSLYRDSKLGVVETRKFSGRLAEIKDCVSQVRQWLDQGVALNQIAVISCTLETDFPALKSYFMKEGIPVSGSAVGKVHSLPSTQEGFARLRLWGQEARFSDLLTAFREKVPGRFEKFEGLYKNLLSTDDLARQLDTQKKTQDWRWSDLEVSLEGLYREAKRIWPASGLPILHRLFEKIFEVTPKASVLPLSKWIQWLELMASKVEIPNFEEGLLKSLTITSHRSAESPLWTHRYFLNLVEGEFSKDKNLLGLKEINFLGSQYGFYLDHPEQSIERFEMAWLLSQKGSTDILGYPLTDWSGGPTTPNPEWMMRSQGKKDVHSPGETRWDSIQHRQESNPDQMPSKLIPFSNPGPLSISSIESYLDCPFIFSAKKRFNLRDESEADITLDPRQKGTLIHRILEKIFTPPVNWNLNENQIQGLLEDIRLEMADLFIWDSVWPSLKKNLAQKTWRVLEFERGYQKQYPRREILKNEADFKLYFDPKEKKWGRVEIPGALVFKGKVDRIDGAQGQGLALLDYKSSSSSAQGINNWIKDNKLQMGFYSWVVDQGFMESLTGPVMAGTFLGLKTMDRSRGFQSQEGVGLLYSEEKPKNFGRAQVESLWRQILEEVERATLEIIEGHYLPSPRIQTLCDKCEWRGLCRAPHLNR